MKIWNGIDSVPADRSPVVATIGNYDGVHLGHREILRRVIEDAARAGANSMLVTFDPHPLAVLAPERAPRLLQTRRQKLDALGDCGLSDLVFVEFTREIAGLDGTAFVERLLGEGLALTAVHVGDGFRFGRGREGDAALLESIGTARGFRCHRVPPVRHDGVVVSSSEIRRAIEAGHVERAAAMLGRPYELTGEVHRGDGRGRELDCPTANVEVDNALLPRAGVYVTETLALSGRFASVTNVGVRPTFGGERVSVESHLLEFEDELYGEAVRVRFLAHLRDEMRFPNASTLADQLARDRAATESFFQNQPIGR